MTLKINANRVGPWLDAIGVDRLVVVSPHLDDAVLSLAGLLRGVGPLADVLTVFTESDPQVGVEWARRAGFADAAEEHAARRREDRNALQFLGGNVRHAGLRSGELSEAAAAKLLTALDTPQVLAPVSNLARTGIASARRALFLLPAGCGGHHREGSLSKLMRRLLRIPFGSAAHPEHEAVRDRFWAALAQATSKVGFYAELPYAWRQSDRTIRSELEALIDRRLEMVHFKPDVEDKWAATRHYRSQADLILGTNPHYQRKVLSRPECLFLVSDRTGSLASPDP